MLGDEQRAWKAGEPSVAEERMEVPNTRTHYADGPFFFQVAQTSNGAIVIGSPYN